MAVKLVWTRRAIQGYDRIIKYLEEKWSEKEVKNFVSETVHFFDLLRDNPKMLEPTGKHKNLYRGPINRLTIVTYRYKPRKKEIVLVNIREARRQPLK
ncbi:MAG: type II toxin-antitoxin system RelE/ParE family toxin [Bacteroidota bacterium]